jgi:hypothetical protein
MANPITALGFQPIDFACRIAGRRVTFTLEYRYLGSPVLEVRVRYRPVRGPDVRATSKPLPTTRDGTVRIVLPSGAARPPSAVGRCAGFVVRRAL